MCASLRLKLAFDECNLDTVRNSEMICWLEEITLLFYQVSVKADKARSKDRDAGFLAETQNDFIKIYKIQVWLGFTKKTKQKEHEQGHELTRPEDEKRSELTDQVRQGLFKQQFFFFFF